MITSSFIAGSVVGFILGVASLMILRTVLYNANRIAEKEAANGR